MSRLAAYRRSAGTSTVLILTVLYFPLSLPHPWPPVKGLSCHKLGVVRVALRFQLLYPSF